MHDFEEMKGLPDYRRHLAEDSDDEAEEESDD